MFSYSLVAVDAGKNAVLILSAAFDTVDHNVLIAWLQHLTGAQLYNTSTLISKTGLFL